jgi:hypothetical protein
MSIYTQTIQGVYTPLVSAVRNATQILAGRTLIDPNYGIGLSGNGINPEVSGIIAYLNVTVVPGVDTVQLVLEEQDPASGVWSPVAATTATAVTGLVKLKVKQAITAIAATTTQVQVQDTLPAIWRVRVVHSAGSNFTYSLGIVLYN